MPGNAVRSTTDSQKDLNNHGIPLSILSSDCILIKYGCYRTEHFLPVSTSTWTLAHFVHKSDTLVLSFCANVKNNKGNLFFILKTILWPDISWTMHHWRPEKASSSRIIKEYRNTHSRLPDFQEYLLTLQMTQNGKNCLVRKDSLISRSRELNHLRNWISEW